MTKRNLTLAIDEKLLERVRIAAARRKTSVTELVRRHLELLSEVDGEHEQASAWLKARMTQRPIAVGKMEWSRDDLHER